MIREEGERDAKYRDKDENVQCRGSDRWSRTGPEEKKRERLRSVEKKTHPVTKGKEDIGKNQLL